MLNRFSKDIGFLDDELPQVLLEYSIVHSVYLFHDYVQYNFFQLLTRVLAIVITAVTANPYMLIVVVILFIIFISLRWYYLKTARDIKRLEALGLSTLQYVSVNYFYSLNFSS